LTGDVLQRADTAKRRKRLRGRRQEMLADLLQDIRHTLQSIRIDPSF